VSYWTFEFKETEGELSWFVRAPGGTDFIVGVWYPVARPAVLLTPDAAYDLAKTGRYSYNPNPNEPDEWRQIGDWMDFIRWMGEKLDRPISLPEPFPDELRPHFKDWERTQVLPWRELIRRHFDPASYVTDVDMQIARGPRQQKKAMAVDAWLSEPRPKISGGGVG
jgi:hypothetical protein